MARTNHKPSISQSPINAHLRALASTHDHVCRTFRRDRWRNHNLLWRQRTRAKMARRRFSRGFGNVSDERLALDIQKMPISAKQLRSQSCQSERQAILLFRNISYILANHIEIEMATWECTYLVRHSRDLLRSLGRDPL